MSNKSVIKVVLLVLLVLIAVVGIVMALIFAKNNDLVSNKKEETFSLDLDDMYCNIKDSNKIIKVNITIEANNKKTIETLSEKVYLVRDEINQIIRSKTEDQLKGKEGQVNLQDDIRETLINIFDDKAITNVYFNDFVMQ